MSRYTGPSWKQSRRLGFSLTGTGKELARRNYVPGQHGPNNRSKLSEYGLQLPPDFPPPCPVPPVISAVAVPVTAVSSRTGRGS